MSTEVARREGTAVALPETFSLEQVVHQVKLIQQVMHTVMKKDEHYGIVPGTGTKPSLLKAGAEKLCLTFRLDPQYDITERQDGAHRDIMSKCTLYHIPSGQRFGSGMGSCSTRESKYAYRNAGRKCPACGAEAIIKGKDEYGGGWVCFKKKNGCGAKFPDGDREIESQATGRVANEDVADQYNTVLKMANKRSLVAAVLNATAASDIFTQDIEDLPRVEPEEAPRAAPAQAPIRGKQTAAERSAAILARFEEFSITAEQLQNRLGKGIHMATKGDLEAAYAHFQKEAQEEFVADMNSGEGRV